LPRRNWRGRRSGLRNDLSLLISNHTCLLSRVRSREGGGRKKAEYRVGDFVVVVAYARGRRGKRGRNHQF